MTRAIHWFRRDLRLADNAALLAAARSGDVVPVFVHAPEEEAPWEPGAASRWWLHQSLAALDADLRQVGSRLIVRRGPAAAALVRLAQQTGATSVHWNRLYEPAVIARDTQLKAELAVSGLQAESHAGHLLFEPWTVRTASGGPYRVFTPFWRACSTQLDLLPPPQRRPRRLPPVPDTVESASLASLGLLPRVRWDAGFASAWLPGEAGAQAELERFVTAAMANYADGRNRPDLAGTSRLSPHLHHGEVTPRQALAAAQAAALTRTTPGIAAGRDSFVRELGWREFGHHLLFHFPATAAAPLDSRFEALAWRHDPAGLAAWQRGRTGIPIIDAGMRELWHTGWMHNRVRMLVASALTKNLFLHWRHGARWFWDTLVDADLASNTLGWQWTAGCGADAAPYYRIFNPVLQAERFDPQRAYIRRWLPELARLPDACVHQPWTAPAAVLAAAGVRLGADYPAPIIDLKSSRDAALGQYQRLKRTG